MNDEAEDTFNQSITDPYFWRNPPSVQDSDGGCMRRSLVRGTPCQTRTEQSVAHQRVLGISFGVMSAADVLQSSVAEVNQTTLYERALPRTSGMNDTRFGVSERFLKCASCTNETLVCDGHTGHITLAEPVYHAGFLSYIVRIIRSVCFFCGELSVPGDDDILQRLRVSCAGGLAKQYFTEATEYLKGKRQCWREECRAPYPTWVQQVYTIFFYVCRDFVCAMCFKYFF
jgi:hypothetical protein